MNLAQRIAFERAIKAGGPGSGRHPEYGDMHKMLIKKGYVLHPSNLKRQSYIHPQTRIHLEVNPQTGGWRRAEYPEHEGGHGAMTLYEWLHGRYKKIAAGKDISLDLVRRRIQLRITAGGPGSGCHGPNCGRPKSAIEKIEGFQIGSVSDVPEAVRIQLHMTEPEFRPEHEVVAKGISQAIKDMPNHPEGFKEGLQKHVSFVFAGYEPKEAAMTSVNGMGKSLILVNTAYDYAKAEKTNVVPGFSVATKQGGEKDMEAVYKYSTWHEFGHMLDAVSGDQITNAVMDSLILGVGGSNVGKIRSWISKNISPYAATSPKEAAAEVVALRFGGHPLPKELGYVEEMLK